MLWRKSSEKGQGFEIFNRVKKAGFVEEGWEGVIQLGNSKCKCPEVGLCLTLGRRPVRLK